MKQPRFTKIAREWRCKYAMDAEGTPAKSECLKACQALLAEYLPTLNGMPNAEVAESGRDLIVILTDKIT